MMMPSQTIPVASTRAAGAPKGASNNTSAASRTPMPPCVIGITAAIFASGQAKSQTRSGRTSPQDIPSSQPKSRRCGWRETERIAWRIWASLRRKRIERPRKSGRCKIKTSERTIAATTAPANKTRRAGACSATGKDPRRRISPAGIFQLGLLRSFPAECFLPDESSAKNLVNFFRQLEIVIADSLHAVRIQIDRHFVPHVEPFRMMIHRFGDQRDARHVPESRDEILARKLLVQFSIRDAPAFCLRQQR